MNIQPSKKMDLFGQSVFGDLKNYAKQQQQNGMELIDLSLGSPDIPPHEMVRKVLSEKSALDTSYGYTLTGSFRFNKAVADYYKRRSNVDLNPNTDIIQTIGSQEGLVHIPIAFCDPGDIILTTNPAYIAYEAGINLTGATPFFVPLDEETFLPNLKAIPTEIAEKAKMLILNLPGNPVPAMPSLAYFAEVIDFAKKYNVIILHDAAYSEFYYTGDAPISFLSAPGAMEVGMEINSLSKSFSLAGTRIAYVAGNSEMIAIIKQLKSNLDFGTFDPIQESAAVALDHAEMITENLRVTFAERHHTLMEGLQKIGWIPTPSNGGMFIWAKYPYALNSVDFAYKAIEQTGVVMVPGTTFGSAGEGYVRLALVQPTEVLEKAVERLAQLTI